MSRVYSSANTEAHGETIIDEVSFDVASLDNGASSRHKDAFVCSIVECTNTPDFLPAAYPTILYHISLDILILLKRQTTDLEKASPAGVLHPHPHPYPSSTFTDAGVWPLLHSVSKGVLLVLLHLSKVKFRAHHPSVDVLDVLAGALEVGGGVV